jgi:hypothetical protein
MAKTKVAKRRTLTFSELKRLSVCNSDSLPSYVELRGKVRGKTVRKFMWWTGVGWVDVREDEAENPALVTED